jgi:hypothetical protein
MGQLTFSWDDPHGSESSGVSATAGPISSTEAPKVSPIPSRGAQQCRCASDALEKHIAARHDSANRMLALPPTRKRLQEAESQRQQATRLERIRRTLQKLAEMHEDGTITPALAALTSRAAVERALFTEGTKSTIHGIFNAIDRAELDSERILRLTREAMLLGIPGFFPTPESVAEDLVKFACFERVTSVLEPSAGIGSLVDAFRRHHPHVRISYCEINCFLLDVLRLKYEGTETAHFVGRDFTDIDIQIGDSRFDGVLMNPPFEKAQDIDHVLRARTLLAPGGTLAAIMSEGTFHRSDKKATAFREFLEKARATVVKLPADCFKASGTGVQCRMVRIVANRDSRRI